MRHAGERLPLAYRELRVLDDQAFPAFGARAPQHLAAVVERDFAEAHPGPFLGARADALLQAQPPRDQRLAAQVLVAVLEQVEDDERDGVLAYGARDVGFGDVRWMRPCRC